MTHQGVLLVGEGEGAGRGVSKWPQRSVSTHRVFRRMPATRSREDLVASSNVHAKELFRLEM